MKTLHSFVLLAVLISLSECSGHYLSKFRRPRVPLPLSLTSNLRTERAMDNSREDFLPLHTNFGKSSEQFVADESRNSNEKVDNPWRLSKGEQFGNIGYAPHYRTKLMNDSAKPTPLNTVGGSYGILDNTNQENVYGSHKNVDTNHEKVNNSHDVKISHNTVNRNHKNVNSSHAVDSSHDNVNSNHYNANISNDNVNSNHDNVNSNHDNINSNHGNVNSNHDNVNSNHDNVNSNHDNVNNNSHDHVDNSHDNVNSSHDNGNRNHDNVNNGYHDNRSENTLSLRSLSLRKPKDRDGVGDSHNQKELEEVTPNSLDLDSRGYIPEDDGNVQYASYDSNPAPEDDAYYNTEVEDQEPIQARIFGAPVKGGQEQEWLKELPGNWLRPDVTILKKQGHVRSKIKTTHRKHVSSTVHKVSHSHHSFASSKAHNLVSTKPVSDYGRQQPVTRQEVVYI